MTNREHMRSRSGPALPPALIDAARGCAGQVDAIAQQYVEEVMDLTGYSTSVVSESDLRQTAQHTLALIFEWLQGNADRMAALRDHSAAIGRRRARQGIALETLLRAVRMDYRFIWERIDQQLHGRREELADCAIPIWEAVELHTSVVQSSYTDELAHMRSELEQERTFLLRQLLTQSADRGAAVRTAEALGLPTEGPYYIVAADGLASGRATLSLRSGAADVVSGTVDGMSLMITTADYGEFAPHPEFGIGCAPAAPQLFDLPRAWTLASELAAAASPGTIATLRNNWDDLVVRSLKSPLRSQLQDLLDGVGGLPEADRRILLETVSAYLSSGSAARTATAVHCHRNTVVNRLSRFTSLTGLDVSVPCDAGLVMLALSAEKAAVASQ